MTAKNSPQKAGFTLVEMIGVMAIIAILAAAVAPKAPENGYVYRYYVQSHDVIVTGCPLGILAPARG